MAKVLTDVAIRNLKPGLTRREVPDGGARGLHVTVQPSGAKGFAVRYRYGGRPRKLTLQAGITLAAARKAAADALFEVQQGRDPAAAKQQARQAQRLAAGDTFENIAAEYLKREGDRLRSANWQRSVLQRHVLPALGPRPIGDIRRSEVIRLLDAIEEGSGPVMSDRTLAIIRRVMNWHAIRSDTFASPIVRGMARAGTRERARVLTDGELRAVWTTAEASAAPFGYFLRFALLTACRRNEATHLPWSELADGVWTLPASRNKAGVELVRPLGAAAQDILAKVPRVVGGEFVFSNYGRRPLGGLSRLKRTFDKASGTQGWTIHDLRRTARSLMSRAGINADIGERALGHVLPGVRGIYDRHRYVPEMLNAFEALAAQIERIVSPVPNVVSLPARG